MDKEKRKILEVFGPDILSDADLIEIIFGTNDENVVSTIHELFINSGLETTYGEAQSAGLTENKSLKVATFAALSKRLAVMKEFPHNCIKGAEDVYKLMAPRIKDKKTESLYMLSLDRKLNLISTHRLSDGARSSTQFDLVSTLKMAILDNASAMIFCHNHPSGDPTPSDPDIASTRAAKECGELLGIDVTDHVIIAGDSYLSMQNEGVI